MVDKPADSQAYYDRYWRERDADRTRARSQRRAELALGLLRSAGIRGGSLLEAGCGPGWALEKFRQAGFAARGIELSEQAAREAASRGLDVERADLESRPPTGQFDVIAALEVLEHVAQPLPLLISLSRCLSPRGVLVISLPNEFHALRRISILFGRPGFGGHEDPHLRFFRPRSARRLLEAAGLEITGVSWDGLCPPRWRLLKACTDPLASMAPGLFALSGIFLSRPAWSTMAP